MSTIHLDKNIFKHKIIRFAIVGASGTVVNLGVLTLLAKIIGLNVLLSAAIAIELSILSNFFFNHHFTFKVGKESKNIDNRLATSLFTKLVRYNVGSLGGAAISFATFTILYKGLKLNYLLADFLAILIALSWNYFMSVKYVWKTIDE